MEDSPVCIRISVKQHRYLLGLATAKAFTTGESSINEKTAFNTMSFLLTLE